MLKPPPGLVMYSADFCAECRTAKEWFARKGIACTVINVEGKDALIRDLCQATGAQTVPQFFIDGKWVGGFAEVKTGLYLGLYDL